jgi:hypothetical protein
VRPGVGWIALGAEALWVISWIVAGFWQGPRYSAFSDSISDIHAFLMAWVASRSRVCHRLVVRRRKAPVSIVRFAPRQSWVEHADKAKVRLHLDLVAVMLIEGIQTAGSEGMLLPRR